jgi:hypothetical protein
MVATCQQQSKNNTNDSKIGKGLFKVSNLGLARKRDAKQLEKENSTKVPLNLPASRHSALTKKAVPSQRSTLSH